MRDKGMLTFIMELKTQIITLMLYEFIREENSSICDNKVFIFIHFRKEISTDSEPYSYPFEHPQARQRDSESMNVIDFYQ